MLLFLQSVINGLLIGGVYALAAVGVNLMFGVMKLVNFAHGEFLMCGMYVALFFAGLGIPAAFLGIYWIVLPTAAVMAVLGLAFYLLLLDRAAKFGETPQILLTIGLSIGGQGLAQVLGGSSFVLPPNPVNGASIALLGLTFQVGPGIGFVTAVVVAAVLGFVLKRTSFGKRARAVAESAEAAEMLGVNARSVFMATTAIAIGLVGLAGALLVPYPSAGQDFAVMAFLAIVIAGLGNSLGAVAGGLLLGCMQSLTAAYLDLDLSTAAIYVLFLAVLLFRPEGLFTAARRSL